MDQAKMMGSGVIALIDALKHMEAPKQIAGVQPKSV